MNAAVDKWYSMLALYIRYIPEKISTTRLRLDTDHCCNITKYTIIVKTCVFSRQPSIHKGSGIDHGDFVGRGSWIEMSDGFLTGPWSARKIWVARQPAGSCGWLGLPYHRPISPSTRPSPPSHQCCATPSPALEVNKPTQSHDFDRGAKPASPACY